MKLKFKKNGPSSLEDLINLYNGREFKSPYRSTVALLTLFKVDPTMKVIPNELIDRSDTECVFEYEVEVGRGRGYPSCTDLMIVSPDTCIAIEAKRTEPHYETVAQWRGDSWNKREVLQGWLDMINSISPITLSQHTVSQMPYQMIHRAASACLQRRKATRLVYMGFDLSRGKKEYYANNLATLSKLTGSSLKISLVTLSIGKSSLQKDLEKQWDSGNRNLSIQIKRGIVNGSLMSFESVPEIRTF